MKAYLVSTGQYSSYEIDAVFLNKEKAEKYANILNDAVLEVFEIKDDVELPKVFWGIRIEIKPYKDGYMLKSCEVIDKNYHQNIFGLNYSYFSNIDKVVTLEKDYSHKPTDEEIERFKRSGYDIYRKVLAMLTTGISGNDIEKWLKAGAK